MNLRHECKFIMNNLDVFRLKSRISPFMEHDNYSSSDETYFIKSLYFDNYQDKVVREKINGISNREKFRIRYYNDDMSFIRLEKKSKINGLCGKESTIITKEQCQNIIDGNIDFMIKSDDKLLNELYAKMQYQLLRPKCIVTYQREAFIYKQGNVRITIDMDICRCYDINKFLDDDITYFKVLQDKVVEVKWDEYLPSIIKDIVQVERKNNSTFSKYVASRI